MMLQGNLARQKALVTGANSGIGRAVALALGRAGADVAVNFIDREESANQVVQEIQPAGTKVITIKADVSREDEVEQTFNRAIKALGEALHSLQTLIPYGRIGEPDDVARAAAWLASDDADYLVGTTFFIDGGMTLFPGFATGG